MPWTFVVSRELWNSRQVSTSEKLKEFSLSYSRGPNAAKSDSGFKMK